MNRLKTEIRRAMQCRELVALCSYRDWDTHEKREYTDKISLSQIADMFLEYNVYSRAKISFGMIKDIVQDNNEDCRRVFTMQEFEEFSEEKERKELEAYAARICKTYGCKAGTTEFLTGIHLEIERFSDYREGMREDGLCIGYGVSYAQWQEEFNESTGDTNEAHRMLRYCEKFMPLLCARWEARNALDSVK